MKRNYKIILPIVLIAGILASFTFRKQSNPEKDRAVLQVVRYILTEGHYEPKAIDDTFSKGIFDGFLETLDGTKRYFYASDIQEFSAYKYLIDDQILLDDLTFFYLVYDRYQQRLAQSENYIEDILKNPFDLDIDESIFIEYKDVSYADNELEMKDLWRKHLKWRYISTLYDKEKMEEDLLKNDSTYIKKPLKFLEKEALEKTKENMEDLQDRMQELDQDDFFAMFLNTITAQFEPHTSYLDPKLKKRFDISMSGKLEGIGARLQKEGEYTKVFELISGGPAWRTGNLEVGDLILKVAQGSEEPLDIVGMRLDDAIEFIKGKKGTEVRLTLKKVDGTIEIISIIRDVVELEETFVKSSIVEKDGKKYGVIHLPKFYFDMDGKNFHNSSTDMAQEIDRLKKEEVSGILIDLRDNGGGSLKTAIEISGMFIDKGPVVQVKYRGEKPQIKDDNQSGVLWDGPLVVLVNETSASASEIFAAAMQDYKRAVIIGSKQTYGKGTVQNFYELNNYFNYPEDLGSLKMTIQKFYRINGGSTQLKGVAPDIILPSRYSYLDIGERDELHPMQWDKIKAASYDTWNGYKNYNQVIQNTQKEIDTMHVFKLIDQNAQWLSDNQKEQFIPLDFIKYKQEIAANNDKAKAFKELNDYESDLAFRSPKYEILLMETDSLLDKKRTIWHTDLKKDITMQEGIDVLSQLEVKNTSNVVSTH